MFAGKWGGAAWLEQSKRWTDVGYSGWEGRWKDHVRHLKFIVRTLALILSDMGSYWRASKGVTWSYVLTGSFRLLSNVYKVVSKGLERQNDLNKSLLLFLFFLILTIEGLEDTGICRTPESVHIRFPALLYEKGFRYGDKWASHLDNRARQIWLLGMPSLVIAPSGFAGWGDHTYKYQVTVKLPCVYPVKVCRQELARKTLIQVPETLGCCIGLFPSQLITACRRRAHTPTGSPRAPEGLQVAAFSVLSL